jgi:hypothetical protein
LHYDSIPGKPGRDARDTCAHCHNRNHYKKPRGAMLHN